MNSLQRHYLKEFFRLLLLISLGLSIIFCLIDLIGKIADFLHGKPSAGSLILYASYSLPRYFIYLLPMSVFICSLFTFSQAARRNELVAVRAAGGRLRELFGPFIVTGVLICAGAFIVSEFVVPDFSERAARLRSRLEGRTKKSAFANGAAWLRDRLGNPVKIDFYMPEEKRIYGLNIYISGESFLKNTISGETAVWNGRTWTVENATLYDSKTGNIKKLKKMDYNDLEAPDIFSHSIRNADEMGIIELYKYMTRLKAAGFNNTKLFVDFNSKLSFPLINIFMMFLGLSLSVRSRIGGGLFTAGLGLAISLMYWFGYTFSLSIGYAGILPPFIAAWSIPAVFGSVALQLFITMPE